MLEKLAPAFVADVPAIVKPASPTAYLAEATVGPIVGSGLMPEGSPQPVYLLPAGLDSLARTASAASKTVPTTGR